MVPQLRPAGAAMASQHKFLLHTSSLQCYVCFKHAPADKELALQWLATPCRPDPMLKYLTFNGTRRPTRVPAGQVIRINQREIHDSHRVMIFKGLYFCNQCGYYGSRHLQKLAAPCLGMKDARTRNRVLKLLQGKLPSGLEAFPNDSEALILTDWASYPEEDLAYDLCRGSNHA